MSNDAEERLSGVVAYFRPTGHVRNVVEVPDCDRVEFKTIVIHIISMHIYIYIYYGKVMCNRYVEVDEVNTAIYDKMQFLPVYIGKKIGRAIDLFFCECSSKSLPLLEKHIQNFWDIFIRYYFLCYAVLSFAVKSDFCIYVGTTKPVRLHVTPKHGHRIIFMSPLGRDPYPDSIILRTLPNSSSNMPKSKKIDLF